MSTLFLVPTVRRSQDSDDAARPLSLTRLEPEKENEFRFPRVKKIMRRTRATAQTFYAEASDTNVYVVKAPDENGTCRVLFREALGSILGSHLTLPMAEWAPLRVPAKMAQIAGIRSSQDHTLTDHDLLCFGSRLPAAHGQILEILPTSWLRGTDLAREIVRMKVFDCWVGQTLPRQYLAFRRTESGPLEIQFIRNASILCHPLGGTNDVGSFVNPYLDAERMGIGKMVVAEMLERIAGVTRSTLERVLRSIPKPWIDAEQAEIAIDILAQRQGVLLVKKGQKWAAGAKTGDKFHQRREGHRRLCLI